MVVQEAQHNSSTPMPSSQHVASLRDSPSSGRSQHSSKPAHSLSPSFTPTARRLDTLGGSQNPGTVVKPGLGDTLDCRTQPPAGGALAGSGGDKQEQQSELSITPQTSEVQGAAEQRQLRASGPSNRHLSEEDAG